VNKVKSSISQISFLELTWRFFCRGQNQFSKNKKIFPEILPLPGIKKVRCVADEKRFLGKTHTAGSQTFDAIRIFDVK